MMQDQPSVDDERQESGLQRYTGSVHVGGARVDVQAEAPVQTELHITVEARHAGRRVQESILLGQPILAPARQTLRERLHRLRGAGLDSWLLALALALYIGVCLFQIDDYPIYFFTDEAVQTVLAADLVRDRFHSYDDELLPTYFYNGYQYNLGVSVYLQVLPYMLFGKSVALTRSVAAIATLLGAAALGLTLRLVFRVRQAWTAVLLLSLTPAWFLHSRTAFETGLAATFFAIFLFCYLMYRTSSPNWLYAAVAAGALTFYSYSPARMVMVVCAALLFFCDPRYHLRHRRTLLIALGLLVLLAVPYVRFTLNHPGAGAAHLRVLSSYWIQPISTLEKLQIFGREYLRGLNPFYWYWPNAVDLARHRMDGYGHVFWFTFPLLAAGLVLGARSIRQPEYRVLLLALVAAPSGAALVALGITRALSMVMPLALLSGLGLAWLMEWANRRLRTPPQVLPLAVFALLAAGSLLLTRAALVRGPLWHTDYGLGGMQWGAQQLFAEVRSTLAKSPASPLVVSPSWANGTDTVARFFFSDPLPFKLASIDGYIDELKDLDEHTLFIMIPEEYRRMEESGKFTNVQVEKTLNYPDGSPGFYFVRLAYVDNIADIMMAEKEARKVLQETEVSVGSEVWQVKYSYLDMGSVDNIFDGDPETLIRTREANPLVIEVSFPSAREVQEVTARVGGTPTMVRLFLTGAGGEEQAYEQTVGDFPTPREVRFSLDAAVHCTHLRMEVLSTRDQEPAHVHLWEITAGPTRQAGSGD